MTSWMRLGKKRCRFLTNIGSKKNKQKTKKLTNFRKNIKNNVFIANYFY